jgi:hypothetical protein
MEFQINYKNRIFSPHFENFDETAMELYYFQATNNPVYRNYHFFLGINPHTIQNIKQIPFLPIKFFSTQNVICENLNYQLVFHSSGTTSLRPGKHYVTDPDLYLESLSAGFKFFYGDPAEYIILALIPSYLQNPHSSLGFMVNELIKQSMNKYSGFYLDDPKKFISTLNLIKNLSKRTLIIGLSYALVDVFNDNPYDLSTAIIMETGGMKGRKKEMTREELHTFITSLTNQQEIHSEYGMTELFSQAYSDGKGVFKTVPWMKVLITEPNDPFNFLEIGENGLINIIDLANRNTCSFIATRDTGKMLAGDKFEVTGRMDQSELRGCNLLYF